MNQREFNVNYERIGFWVVVVIVLALAIQLIAPFFAAILGGAVLTVLTYPLYHRLQKKMADWASALVTVLTTLFLVAVPLALVGLMVTLQARAFVQDLEAGPNGAKSQVTVDSVVMKADDALKPLARQIGSDFSLHEWFNENRQEITKSVGGGLTRLGVNTLQGAILLIIAFLCNYFMLKQSAALKEPVLEVLPLSRAQSEELLERLRRTVHAVFRGVIMVAFIQGMLGTVGYLVTGVNGWLLWGAATVVCAAIPFLGAPIVYIPLSLVLLSQGKLPQGLGLLAFGLLIISNIDNVLRPKYIGDKVGLPYMATFFGLLGGVLAYGPVGLMFGPCVATAVLWLIDVVRTIRRETVASEAA